MTQDLYRNDGFLGTWSMERILEVSFSGVAYGFPRFIKSIRGNGSPYRIEEKRMSDIEVRMGDLSVEDYSPKSYHRDQLIEGELIRVDEDGLIINVGLKTEGIILP